MGNFLDLLVFIGALYKLAVTAVIVTAIGAVIIFIFSLLLSLVEWIF
jgi:hypothetical protein